ncbi:MAG: sigma-54 interaction domain-containing protein [Nitrospinota bacterium]
MRVGLYPLIEAIDRFISLPEEERCRLLLGDVSRLLAADCSVILRVCQEEGWAKVLYCLERNELSGLTLPLSECPELAEIGYILNPMSIRLSQDSRLLERLGIAVEHQQARGAALCPITNGNIASALLLIRADETFPESAARVLAQMASAVKVLFTSAQDPSSASFSEEVPSEVEETDIEMVGASEAMRRVFSTIRKFASVDAPVLIMGESGTGKELSALSIHERSSRKKGPFVPINCGAIPENLLESELFGYEKGAFTGAYGRKKGKVEVADGGTLFLDEVGELPFALQVKLLRFLEGYQFERVGGNQTLEVDVRVIAATNKDLSRAVRAGEFREDLFYRLAVLSLSMPPLRERGEDPVIMARVFLQRYVKESNGAVKGFVPEALDAIRSCPWPGNIRELVNIIRRAVVLAEGELLTPSDLVGLEQPDKETPASSLIAARERLEREFIQNSLSRNERNIARAARELGVSRPHLYGLMKKYNLSPKAS